MMIATAVAAAGSSASGHFVAMVVAFRAGFLESQRVHKKAFGLADFPHRQHRSVEALHGDVAADLIGGPAAALVGIVFNHFDLQSGGVIEAEIFRPEAFLDAFVGHFVPLHVFFPEFDGSLGHGVRRRLDLARTRTAFHAVEREGGVNRARFAVRVGIVEVIVSVSTVEKDSLLDQALSADLRHKIDIFLGAAGANSDVM